MTEIIDYFEANGSISHLKDIDDNIYTIYFNTRASYYYCINEFNNTLENYFYFNFEANSPIM
jgi:hypothetical protein